MGKLIYQPKGKAKEYSPWACNLYNGCSNRCTYCYNRKGIGCKLLGKDEPTLKAGLTTMEEVKHRWLLDYYNHADQILEDGNELFYNFVSDPCLPETIEMNMACIELTILKWIDVRLLTKRKEIVDFLKRETPFHYTNFTKFANTRCREKMNIGFTLTGQDDLEPGASTNAERIEAIRELTKMGFKTWASIEPIIYINDSYRMIQEAFEAGCREFKIGLLSGKKAYSKEQVAHFKSKVITEYGALCNILFKDSVINYIS